MSELEGDAALRAEWLRRWALASAELFRLERYRPADTRTHGGCPHDCELAAGADELERPRRSAQR